MRLIIILVVAAIAALIFGGQNVYTAVTNTEPTEYSIEEYDSAQHQEKWIKLTDGYLEVLKSVWEGEGEYGKIDKVYIPYQPSVEQDLDAVLPIRVLIESDDSELIALITELRLKNSLDDEDYYNWVFENFSRFYVEQDVQGLVRFGVNDTSSDIRKDIKGLYENLTEDFVVIQMNAKPEPFFGIFLLTLGAFIIFILIKVATRKNKAALS